MAGAYAIRYPRASDGTIVRAGSFVRYQGIMREVRSMRLSDDGWSLELEDGQTVMPTEVTTRETFGDIIDDALGWAATDRNRRELVLRCEEVARGE